MYPLGLGEAEDADIWVHAQQEGFLIVTKDADFSDLSLLRGFPPKVIWVRRGNCQTSEIERILREHYGDVEALARDKVMGVLTLL